MGKRVIFKKGQRCRKLPPFLTVLSVTVKDGKQRIPAKPVTLSMMAGLTRDQVDIPRGNWFFYVELDGYLHIYPHPGKPTVVKVRYQPPLREV